MVVLSEPECKCYYNEPRSFEDRDTLLGCVYIKVPWCFVFCFSRNCLSVASRISNCKRHILLSGDTTTKMQLWFVCLLVLVPLYLISI